MLPSQRRAELSRHDFDNSYLSRKALAAEASERERSAAATAVGFGASGATGGGGGGGRPAYGKEVSSSHSRTTAGLTTLEDDDHDDFIRMRGGASQRSEHYLLSPATFSRAGSSHLSDESDFSDEDSLGSVNSADSVGTVASKYASIRYANSTAGQIWGVLDGLDDLVMEVKVNVSLARSHLFILVYLVPGDELRKRLLTPLDLGGGVLHRVNLELRAAFRKCFAVLEYVQDVISVVSENIFCAVLQSMR